MTAVFLLLEKFVCGRQSFYLLHFYGLMEDGVVVSTNVQAVGDKWKMKLLFLCVVSHLRCLSCLFPCSQENITVLFFVFFNRK